MIAYVARFVTERVLGLLLFLLGSGWVLGARGILWFIAYFAAIGILKAIEYQRRGRKKYLRPGHGVSPQVEDMTRWMWAIGLQVQRELAVAS